MVLSVLLGHRRLPESNEAGLVGGNRRVPGLKAEKFVRA
jgi:hypothetical protein